MIRVIIADDHPVVRAGLRDLLARRPSYQIVAEVSDTDKLLAVAAQRKADVVLLDVSMPGPPFYEILPRLREVAPETRVLMLTMHPEDQFAVRAIQAGAAGYITKDRPPDEILTALVRVSEGGRYASPALIGRLVRVMHGDAALAPHESLSAREFQVLCRLGSGKRVTEVATELGLSPKTVSTYRARLMAKMGFETRSDLVQYVARHGLLQ